jgi:hypothetical protein
VGADVNAGDQQLAWLHGGAGHGTDTAARWEEHPDGGKRLVHAEGTSWADDVITDEAGRLYHKPTGAAIGLFGRPHAEALAHLAELLVGHGTITQEEADTGLASHTDPS